MKFTTEQAAAVDIAQKDLDACVVAGPGSGKTTVLVEYFRRLVEAEVDPLGILAITFTEKAAGNMRTRLAEAFADNLEVRGRLERAWVSTVHGFCSRLLRENAVFAGVDPEFYVADERESWKLQQEAIAAAMEELFRDDPAGVRALIRGLSSYEFELAILSAYDAMRCAGVGVADLDRFAPPAGVSIAEIADTLQRLADADVYNWSATQREQFDSAREGGTRIVAAQGTLEALRALAEFSCNLNRCKRAGSAYSLLQTLKAHVETARHALITEHYAAERGTLLDIFCRFDRLYRGRKRRAGALDFSDLEEFTVRLLAEHPENRERVRAQFEHILMDEFQDTNGQQSRLLELVRPRDRFYAVGDLNQSIYGFRHAEPRGFQEYRDTVAASGRRLVELTGNFRSRPEILSAVETILDHREGIEPRPLVACREFPDTEAADTAPRPPIAWRETADAELPGTAPRDTEFPDTEPRPQGSGPRRVPYNVEALYAPDEQMEAQWVARRTQELLEMYPDLSFRDVAVLVRNTEVLPSFTDAFDQAGIPYVVNRGKGFYESREVNDLSHLLGVIDNPRDEVSLATVLRSPLVGVSDAALLRLRMMGENMGAAFMRLSLADAGGFDAEDFAALAGFRDRLRQWRIRRDYVSFDRLLLAAIDDCGYAAARNIDKFLAQAREAAGRMTLAEFVQELALVRASNPREPDSPPEDSANSVKMMTVHSAKGLEFPIVFLAAMHKGINTGLAAVEFSRQFGLGVTWRHPVTNEEEDDLYQSAIQEERKRREKEESHRLLYVAMTRAEQHLVLSFSGRKQNWASLLVESLDLDIKTPCEELVVRHAPDGKRWRLRIMIADRAPVMLASAAVDAPQRTEIELLSAPAVVEQHDTASNVTALATFAGCPRKYYLGTYLGFGRNGAVVNGGPGTKLPAAELGAQVHALLAGLPVANPDPEAERLAATFRKSPLGRRAAQAARIEREFDFIMTVEDLVVRGQVDLWFEEGGELVIVDYKTDAVTAVEALQRAGDYALQLRLYAMAIERIAGRPADRAFLHFLRPDRIVEIDLTPTLLDSPEQIVRDLQEAQAALEFPVREGSHCRRCEFFADLCPVGQAAPVTEPRPRGSGQ